MYILWGVGRNPGMDKNMVKYGNLLRWKKGVLLSEICGIMQCSGEVDPWVGVNLFPGHNTQLSPSLLKLPWEHNRHIAAIGFHSIPAEQAPAI